MGETNVLFLFERERNGCVIKFRVQEIRPCDKVAVVEFMVKYFMPEESYFRGAGIHKSQEAVEEMKEMFIELMTSEENACIVCCIDHEDVSKLEIVGLNLLFLSKADDKFDLQFKTPEAELLFKTFGELNEECKKVEHLELEPCLSGAGLCVHPDYRGCGIATEILKARRPLLEKRGLKATSAWFTSAGSQKAALKAGYKELTELSYEELGKRTGVVFTDVPPTSKYMVLII